MTLTFRTIEDGERAAFRDALMGTFGFDDADADPEGVERMRALVPASQCWAAFDGPTIVGTAATFDLELKVPGGAIPMAGLTMVTVRPTHRRRGILRELMRLHLEDAHTRGFAASGLWASEARIYGRFGYGIAAEGEALTVSDAGHLAVAEGRALDEVAWLDEALARATLPELYAKAVAQRPGAIARSPSWWDIRRFAEVPIMRGGASRRRHVMATRAGVPVGYVAYRQRPSPIGVGAGKTELIELQALDGQAEATLWRYLLAMDLFPNLAWSNAPTDTLLPLLVDDPRKVQRSRSDTLWLRIDDVARALSARSYDDDGALTLEVEGQRFALEASAGNGTCAPSPHTPDLSLDRPALSALFLGRATATQLARAGLVAGEDRALRVADRLFASRVAPWCPEIF